MLRYDDRVNDMDFYGKLKITFKGPNSLGNNNDNNIAAKYRGIDPSYIGRMDFQVCGTSDPGTSAVLTPFCKTNGLFFDEAREPEDFKFKFDKDVYEKTSQDDDYYTIGPSFDSVEDYFNYSLTNNQHSKEMKFEKKEKKKDMYTIEINLDEEDLGV